MIKWFNGLSFIQKSCLLILVAVLCYLGLLNNYNAWHDEQYTLTVFSYSWSDMIRVLAREDGHPPFHYILLRAWMSPFGYYALAWGRCFNILCIVLTACLGIFPVRRLYGEKVALWFIGLVLFFPVTVYLICDLRMYGLAFLLMTAVWVYALCILRFNLPSDWIKFILFSFMAVWTHYYCGMGLCIVYAILGYRLLYQFRWRDLMKLFGCGVMLCVVFSPWIMNFLGQYHYMKGKWFVDYQKVLEGFNVFVLPYIPNPLGLIVPVNAFILVSIWFGIIQFFADRKKEFKTDILSSILIYLLVFVLAFSISVLIRPMLFIRYFIILNGFLFLSFAISVCQIKFMKKVFILFLILGFGASYDLTYQRIHSDFIKEFSQMVRKDISVEDSLIICEESFAQMIWKYYLPEYEILVTNSFGNIVLHQDEFYDRREEKINSIKDKKRIYLMTPDYFRCQYPFINRIDFDKKFCLIPMTSEEAEQYVQRQEKQNNLIKTNDTPQEGKTN